MARIKHSPMAEKIADLIMEHYNPKDAQSAQDAIKEAFAPVFERILNAELDAHLGYSKSSTDEKETTNRRNGYSKKTIQGSFGEAEINTPRDREGTFEPVIIPKREKDVSQIEQKVLAMYSRGMSQRDISSTIEDIYGFKLSQDKISTITDLILSDVNEWLNRPLKPLYTFVFVDCIYVKMKNDKGSTENHAVYVILGLDAEGYKEVLGLYISPTESKSCWMNIFDNIKSRGVKDILFLSMDGVSGLEDGVKSIFPQTVVQRCIVHLIRNACKYVPHKDLKAFCADCKAMYGAINAEAAEEALLHLIETWGDKYPGAIRVWENNFNHVTQLFNYPSAIRKIMYTTNAIEAVNSSLRKVTKIGMFENRNAVFKVFYLRITGDLAKKWGVSRARNWTSVLNQMTCIDSLAERIRPYIN